MYATEVEGQTLTLAVSGLLWDRSLVMIDLETESKWSHILGRAMDGEFKGTQLEVIPSVLTDWQTWVELHPDTTVIDMKPAIHKFGTEQYDRRKFVVGLKIGQVPHAWDFTLLEQLQVLNDEVAGTPVVVWFDVDSKGAWAFDRTAGGQVLEFQIDAAGNVTDAKSGSTWNLTRGRANAGALKGTELRPLGPIPSFRKSWTTHYPESHVADTTNWPTTQ